MTWQDVFGEPAHGTHAGVNVSQETALRLVSVYACVSLISDAIASFPLDVFRGSGAERAPLASPAWLEKPNARQTRVTFMGQVVASLLIAGNAYVYPVRGAGGQVAELHPLHPSRVFPRQRADGSVEFVVDGKEVLGPSDLLHIPAFSVPGSLVGLSPIETARQAIGFGLVTEEFGARFFSQGATMSGVIEAPGTLNADQLKHMAKSFAEHHGGVRKSHLPVLLSNGATWKPLSVAPEEAQFLETRRFTVAEIARLYRVPAYMLDPTVSSTWGTGVAEQFRAFVALTLQPWLTRIEAALSGLLPRGTYVRFNLDALLRGSTSDRYAAYATALAAGFLTVNEVRALEDLPPLAAANTNEVTGDEPAE